MTEVPCGRQHAIFTAMYCHQAVGLLTDPTLKRLLSKAFEVGLRFLWTGMCFMVFHTWKHYLNICLGLGQHSELGNETEFLLKLLDSA